jgi:hypothetical protein
LAAGFARASVLISRSKTTRSRMIHQENFGTVWLSPAEVIAYVYRGTPLLVT